MCRRRRRHRFVPPAFALLLLLSAVRDTMGARNENARPKNDDDVSLNSLEDVDLSCDESKCNQDTDGLSSSTTKKPHFFQLTNKSCPTFELPPFFPQQSCDSDRDCWPRICCSYGGPNGQKYCRFPLPSWRNDLLKTIAKRLRSSSPYLQCSPPPPKRYDLFPRRCRSTVDCLPDLCCPESGRNVCRPPKESILPLAGRLSVRSGASAYTSSRRRTRVPIGGGRPLNS